MIATDIPSYSAELPAVENRSRGLPSLHIPSLDGLRTVSFLIVFIAHSNFYIPFVSGIPGGFGVTVFFYLSGFLITTLLRTELESTGTISVRNFYMRRALRILPPFYLVLLLATMLTLLQVLPGRLNPGALLAQSLHFSNYWFIWWGTAGAPASLSRDKSWCPGPRRGLSSHRRTEGRNPIRPGMVRGRRAG